MIASFERLADYQIHQSNKKAVATIVYATKPKEGITQVIDFSNRSFRQLSYSE